MADGDDTQIIDTIKDENLDIPEYANTPSNEDSIGEVINAEDDFLDDYLYDESSLNTDVTSELDEQIIFQKDCEKPIIKYESDDTPKDAAFFPIGNGGIILDLLYEDRTRIPDKPDGEHHIYSTEYTGYFSLTTVDISGETVINNIIISVFIPQKAYDNKYFRILDFSQQFAKHEIGFVEEETIEGEDYYKIKIKFMDYIPTGQLINPFEMKFSGLSIPSDYVSKVFATIETEESEFRYSTGNLLYMPIYEKPAITKYVNSNRFENMKEDGTFVAASITNEGNIEDSFYVSFWYKLGITPYMLREYESITLTDILPVYLGTDGEYHTAIFDATVNPGWVINDDKTQVSYTFTTSQENIEAAQDYIKSISNTELKLRFPYCLIDEENEDDNGDMFLTKRLLNECNIVCVPRNPSDTEIEDYAEDDIIFTLTTQKINEANFTKLNSANVMMDTKAVRNYDYKWSLSLTNPNTASFNHITIEDNGLDERLKFTQLEIESNVSNKIKNIICYSYDGSEIQYSKTEYDKHYFNYDAYKWVDQIILNSEKEYKSIMITFDEDYKMEINDSINVFLYTKFRNPEERHFDREDDSKNIYHNNATASYNQINSGTWIFLTSFNQFKLIEAKEDIWIEKSYLYGSQFEFPTKKPDGTINYEKSERWTLFKINGTLDDIEYGDIRVIDLLPESLVLPDNKFIYGTGGEYVKKEEIIENYHNSGRTALILWLDETAIKEKIGLYNDEAKVGFAQITLKLRLSDDASFGENINEAFLVSEKFQTPSLNHNYTENVYGFTGEEFVRYDTQIGNVQAPAGIYAEKFIKTSNNTWVKSVQSFCIGDEPEFKLKLINTTDTIHKGIIVYDVLPQVNDISISGKQQRNSEFKIDLNDYVITPDGYQVYYTLSESVYEMSMSSVLSDENIVWYDETDIVNNGINLNEITAFKIISNDETELKDEVEFIVKCKIPYISEQEVGEKLEQKTYLDKESGTQSHIEAVNGFGYRVETFSYATPESNYVKIRIPFCGFLIQKTDANLNWLDGAEFSLQKEISEDEWIYVSEGCIVKNPNDAGNMIEFNHLTEGNYRLIEKTAPSGYDKLSTPIAINITLDKKLMEYNIELEGYDGLGNHLNPFLVINEKHDILPNTGGNIYFQYFAGLIMLLLSVALFKYQSHANTTL